MTKFYRLDFRAPKIILSKGCRGTNDTTWVNMVYGGNTVFCSRTLTGLHRFACEALLQKQADGSTREEGRSALGTYEHYRTPRDAYVYEFRVDDLEYIDCLQNLGFRNYVRVPNPGFNSERNPFGAQARLAAGEDIDLHSLMFKTIFAAQREPYVRECDRDPDPVRFQSGQDFQRRLAATAQALSYAHGAALYTEEMMVKGPVAPRRIKLYQTLPCVKSY